MNRNERNTLMVLAGIFLLGALVWILRACARRPVPTSEAPAIVATPPATAVPVSTPGVSGTAPIASVAPAAHPKSTPPPAAVPKTSSTGAPIPPKLELHKELIPKNIDIARCYTEQEITPPGTTIPFDIDGSGFTNEFERMIKVDTGEPGNHVRNLRLVTANQIHGEIVVDPDARTTFVFPRVLIHNLPVFSAQEPYAVIRKGEALTIIFISMEDNGRAGRFRVLTNLDDALFKQFHIVPSTGGLDISDITPRLPYAVEGTLRIGQRVPPGDYGLLIQVGDKTVLRRDGMIRIVRPNVGATGFIQAVIPSDTFHRPGDDIQLYVQGSGFIPANTQDLRAHIPEFDMGTGTFTYVNGGQMRLALMSPRNTPVGAYSVTIQSVQGQSLYEKKAVFQMVPENWIAGVQVAPPVKAGGQSTLHVLGRDLSPEFVQALKIDLDEAGIHLSPLTRVDDRTATATIRVDANVAPGDYWLHLSANGKKIAPPFGSIIKVDAQ